MRNDRKTADTGVSPNGTAAEERRTGVELRLAPGASMFIDIGNCQDRGARPYQEDAFGYSDITSSDAVTEKGILAVLSDGMGGLSDGRIVAENVVQSSISMFEGFDPRLPISGQLSRMIEALNLAVCAKYAEGGVSKAGATAVLVYIYKNRIYWAAAGDSRLYCVRGSQIFRMNEDHDYRNMLYRRCLDGELSPEEAETDPQKDSLVSFIGKEGMPYIDRSVYGCRIRPGDAFILCSDGIYNAVSEDTMRSVVSLSDAQTASEAIVKDVLAAKLPGQDNMTVMVIKCTAARR